jgi:hypothetical protein
MGINDGPNQYPRPAVSIPYALWEVMKESDKLEGKFKVQCDKNKGKIVGYGPNCSNFKEQGTRDFLKCKLDYIINCVETGMEPIMEKCWQTYARYEWMWKLNKMSGAAADSAKRYTYYDAENQKPETSQMQATKLSEERTHVHEGGGTTEYQSYAGYAYTWKAHYETSQTGLWQIKTFVPTCARQADTACECRRCVYTYGYAETGDAQEDESDIPENNVESNPTAEAKWAMLRTNSNYSEIPHVYGRFTVGGNVVFIGNREDVDFSSTKHFDDGTSTVYTETIALVDVAIGICEGPINDVIRIWANDVLIYNRLLDLSSPSDLDGQSVLNMGTMADSDYNVERLNYFIPDIEIYRGSELQPPIDGVDVAHRGLAMVVLKNVDLMLLGDDFPEFKFEVYKTDSDTVQPTAYIESGPFTAHTTIDPEFLSLDIRTGTVYVKGSGGTDPGPMLFDNATLEHRYSVESLGSDITYMHVLPTSMIAAKLVSGETVMIDGRKDKIRRPLPLVSLNGATRSFMAVGFEGTNKPIVCDVDNTGTLRTWELTPENDYIEQRHTVTQASTFTMYDGFIYQFQEQLYFASFAITGGSVLNIKKFRIRDTALWLPNLNSITTASNTLSSLWTGANGVLKAAIYDWQDGHFIVFITTDDEDRIIKINGTTGAIIYNNIFANGFSSFPFGEGKDTLSLSSRIVFIDSANNVIELNKTEGTVASLGTLADFGLPNLAGAQFYDGRSDCIFYISTNNTIIKWFVSAVTSVDVSLKNIVDGICAKTNLKLGRYMDTSSIADVQVGGFWIGSPTTASSALTQVLNHYSTLGLDNGQRLMFTHMSDLPSAQTVVPNEDTLPQSFKTEVIYLPDPVKGIKTTFFEITTTGMRQTVQQLKAEDTPETNVVYTEYTLDIYEPAERMRALSEQVMRTADNVNTRISLSALPRFAYLSAGDVITVDGTEYMISVAYDDAGVRRMDGFLYERDVYAEIVDLTTFTDNSGFVSEVNYRDSLDNPVPFWTTSFTNNDVATCLAGDQVYYIGFDCADRNVIPEDDIAIQFPDDDVLLTPTKPTKGLHAGNVRGNTLPIIYSPYALDNETELTIHFDHPETITLFENFSRPWDVIQLAEEFTNILVIGREVLKFANYSVDPDGRTVTFTNLFRGWNGTTLYCLHHFEGERCFFYTADSLAVNLVDYDYTKAAQRVALTYTNPKLLGAHQNLWFSVRGDAGSCRAYPPVPHEMSEQVGYLNMYGIWYGWDFYMLSVSPIKFDQRSNVGNINTYTNEHYYVQTHDWWAYQWDHNSGYDWDLEDTWYWAPKEFYIMDSSTIYRDDHFSTRQYDHMWWGGTRLEYGRGYIPYYAWETSPIEYRLFDEWYIYTVDNHKTYLPVFMGDGPYMWYMTAWRPGNDVAGFPSFIEMNNVDWGYSDMYGPFGGVPWYD